MKRLVMAALIATASLAGLSRTADAFQLFPPLGGKQAETAGSAGERPPVHLVQAVDASRVTQLEEEIRSLNGRIEEMSFQLLQMQEQIRKFQEDNEFRFQELEKSGTQKSGALDRPNGAGQPQQSVASLGDGLGQPVETGEGVIGDTTFGDGGLGAPERVLGSIELDANGMPVGATLNSTAIDQAALPGVDTGPAAHTGALTSEDDVYQAAYGHVLSGDYAVAETEFKDFIARYPNSSRIADANFWLGEAQYSQGDFNEAAKTFLDAHQAYGSSPKAPEMLLKLGMSMAAGLDNKEAACAVFKEVGIRYPKASRAVISKVATEQKRLSC